MADMKVNTEELGEAIGAAVAHGIAQTRGPQKVPFGEYTRKHDAGRKHLTRSCFQNGVSIGIPNSPDTYRTLKPEEIELLNQIDRGGHYINRRVTVVYTQGVTLEETWIDIRYPNKSIDQRMENNGYWRNFTDMLRQIVAAQAEERQNDELMGKRR